MLFYKFFVIYLYYNDSTKRIEINNNE